MPRHTSRSAIVLSIALLPLSACKPSYNRGGQQAVAPSSLPNLNQTDKRFLPLVLHDEADLKTYLEAFPSERYKTYRQAVGTFYVDTTDDIIKAGLARGEEWEPAINQLMQKYLHPGDTALDIGAHVGTHTLPMAKLVGEAGHVYAFEPQRKIYRELYENLAVNGVDNAVPLRFAVGDGEPRVIRMNQTVPGNEGGTHVGDGGDPAELRSLDSFGFGKVHLMKIDVESFEDHVLDGAKALIAASHPIIIIEIQGGQDYDVAAPDVRAKIDNTRAKLVSLGYRIERIHGADYIALPN